MISPRIGNANPFYTIFLEFLGSNQLEKNVKPDSSFQISKLKMVHVSIDLSLVSFFYLPTTLSSLEIARL